MQRNSGTREMCESQGAVSRQVIHTSHAGQTLKLLTAPWAVLSRPRYRGRFGHAVSQHRSPLPHPRNMHPAWGSWSESGRGHREGTKLSRDKRGGTALLPNSPTADSGPALPGDSSRAAPGKEGRRDVTQREVRRCSGGLGGSRRTGRVPCVLAVEFCSEALSSLKGSHRAGCDRGRRQLPPTPRHTATTQPPSPCMAPGSPLIPPSIPPDPSPEGGRSITGVPPTPAAAPGGASPPLLPGAEAIRGARDCGYRCSPPRPTLRTPAAAGR